MSAGVLVLSLDGGGQSLHHLQGKELCLLLFAFQFLLLALILYMLDASKSPDNVDKQQNEHSNADKKTGQGCDKIYRDTFSSNAKQKRANEPGAEDGLRLFFCGGCRGRDG